MVTKIKWHFKLKAQQDNFLLLFFSIFAIVRIYQKIQMLKAYKYRIYPNSAQKQKLAQHFGCARWVYNWALSSIKSHYEESKKHLSRRELQDQLVALKKTEEYKWLGDVNSQSLLGVLLHIHKAFKAFFKKLTQCPKFKKRHNKQTFECPQHVTIDSTTQHINLPKIKQLKLKLHRSFSGKIKTVTITKTHSNKYYASILIESINQYPPLAKIEKNKTLGIDLGITHFAITSQGNKIPNHQFLKKFSTKISHTTKDKVKKRLQKQI